MLTIAGKAVVVRSARYEELIDLRHAILRQGLPRAEAIFDGDDARTSRHCGAFWDGLCVGCATLHAIPWEGGAAWQLRGMATSVEARRIGVGRKLLEHLEAGLIAAHHDDASVPLLTWCNARVPAVGFYEAMGWRVVSGEFQIPTAGPHVKMIKRLGS